MLRVQEHERWVGHALDKDVTRRSIFGMGRKEQVISDRSLAVPAGLGLGDQQAGLHPFVSATSCSSTQKDLIAIFLDDLTDSEWRKFGVSERRSVARWRARVSTAGPWQSLELGIVESGSQIDRIIDIHHLTVET
jgi:hypothetical protein